MLKTGNKKTKSKKGKSKEERLPAVIDFSTTAVQKAVSTEINQHPLTVYSGFAALGLGLYMSLFGPSSALFGFGLGCFLMSSGSYVLNRFFRQEVFQKKHVDNLREQIRRNTELAIVHLQKELKKFNCIEGAKQIDLFKDKYESLVSVLQKKLQPGSLVFGRFLGMAEQVYKNGLDNLQQVTANLDSISPINPHEIIRQLEKMQRRADSSEAEINALKNTLQKRTERMAEVDRLLRDNVLAMARLDQTAMDISTMETSKERASTDMEAAMNELVHLTDQFKNFKAE